MIGLEIELVIWDRRERCPVFDEYFIDDVVEELNDLFYTEGLNVESSSEATYANTPPRVELKLLHPVESVEEAVNDISRAVGILKKVLGSRYTIKLWGARRGSTHITLDIDREVRSRGHVGTLFTHLFKLFELPYIASQGIPSKKHKGSHRVATYSTLSPVFMTDDSFVINGVVYNDLIPYFELNPKILKLLEEVGDY